jgi:hypothetical protein
MAKRIYSFSIPETNVQDGVLISDIKQYAQTKQLSFSDIIVQALKLYHKEVLCQKMQN